MIAPTAVGLRAKFFRNVHVAEAPPSDDPEGGWLAEGTSDSAECLEMARILESRVGA
ncbi:hypothetical protein RSSM_03256 [Rhodopirellula sallentina SM41]|uniref:Uncharacterized protein n=2 Tax=Rhodopirellula TaxID=265488 RepID=M5U218_9BACT|nr:hypothetical protein RSSM_03256 [Rhodopirellula sallentina SM41]